jgi:hypothetical protein
MASRLSPHFIELVYDVLLKSFWRKKALRNFLRRSHVSENFLGTLSDEESKRDWLDRLFKRLDDRLGKVYLAIESQCVCLYGLGARGGSRLGGFINDPHGHSELGQQEGEHEPGRPGSNN